MCLVKCKGCNKEVVIRPSDVKDIDNYYCRDCLPEYMAKKRKNGEYKSDWSPLKKLNAVAMASGHESIFKR